MSLLADLVPESNRLELAFTANGSERSGDLTHECYNRGFVGAFIDHEDQPQWARRAARYMRDEFHRDSDGRKKRLGDVLSDNRLANDGSGSVLVNCRHALELWIAGGRQGVEPYTCRQDYGSCVDASASEHETTIFGWRAARPEFNEQFKYTAAWYKYANRGYCGDGWGGGGIARVARNVGAAFRIPYNIGSNSVDFTDDDTNENIVARKWCRSGIPQWLVDYTKAHHAYEDGAIVQFEGGVNEIRRMCAAGGVLHTGGTFTSGGSKPFTNGRTGPHMQSMVGCDDSDQFRKFCRDTLNVTPRDNDFPVIMHQTWGNWSGACADQYWPSWWGPKPQGAWVAWASTILSRLDCEYVWLPWVKGFPSSAPPPPPPPPPPVQGEIYGDNIGGKIVIRGEFSVPASTSPQAFIVAPVPGKPGAFSPVPKPVV